jgi:hypothetical protein
MENAFNSIFHFVNLSVPGITGHLILQLYNETTHRVKLTG